MVRGTPTPTRCIYEVQPRDTSTPTSYSTHTERGIATSLRCSHIYKLHLCTHMRCNYAYTPTRYINNYEGIYAYDVQLYLIETLYKYDLRRYQKLRLAPSPVMRYWTSYSWIWIRIRSGIKEKSRIRIWIKWHRSATLLSYEIFILFKRTEYKSSTICYFPRCRFLLQ